MRKCDNCISGRYNTDCNTGENTLYCAMDGYEYEVTPDEVCGSHQFIEGYEDEKHYVAYDEKYLGPGYFIIKEKRGEITDFLKLYIINNHTIPQYGLRVFSCDGRKKVDNDFKNIEFAFRNGEDLSNGLFEVFVHLCVRTQGKIETIDKNKVMNNINLFLDGSIVRVSFSTNVNDVEGEYECNIFGEKEDIGYIDINLGSSLTGSNYLAVEKLFADLSNLNPPVINNQDIQKIIKLKVNN